MMNMVPNNRPSASTGGNVTTSQIQTDTLPPASSRAGTLRLRAAPANQQRVQWADDVIDNEGMGKKSSKGNWLNFSGLTAALCNNH